MENFYFLVFWAFSWVVAVLELSNNNNDRIITSTAFNSFENNYVVVYSHDGSLEEKVVDFGIEKNACKSGWFWVKDVDELMILANEAGKSFCTRADVKVEPPSIISIIMSSGVSFDLLTILKLLIPAGWLPICVSKDAVHYQSLWVMGKSLQWISRLAEVSKFPTVILPLGLYLEEGQLISQRLLVVDRASYCHPLGPEKRETPEFSRDLKRNCLCLSMTSSPSCDTGAILVRS